jgi:hypothetical protein
MITVWTHGRLEPSLWCHARGSFLPCIACLWQLSISWHDARMRWRRRVGVLGFEEIQTGCNGSVRMSQVCQGRLSLA